MQGLFFVVLLVVALVAKFRESSKAEEAKNKLIADLEKGLQVTWKLEKHTLDSGEKFDAYGVKISGTVMLPRPNTACHLVVRFDDVTDSTEKPYPVLCAVPSLADENGYLDYVTPLTPPYEVSGFEDLPVCLIPAPPLTCAARGWRQILVRVALCDARDRRKIYGFGKTTMKFHQEAHGFMEGAQFNLELWTAIARLGIAVCAADGSIDKCETDVLKRYLKQRLSDERHADVRKQVSNVLKTTVAEFQQGHQTTEKLIPTLCHELRALEAPAANQSAYELCAEIAAADGEVDDSETASLEAIARRLRIPDEFVREVHERVFRSSMFGAESSESLLGIPDGLSKAEKVEYLNKEYKKWRGRVTHKDPSVASEAELRLQQITAARRALAEG